MGIGGVQKIATFTGGFILVMLCLIVIFHLVNSRTGRAILAIRDNRIAAESVGIPVTRYKMTAFVISASMAGAAGALFALNYSTIAANKFDFNASILILVFVVSRRARQYARLGHRRGAAHGAARGAAQLCRLPHADLRHRAHPRDARDEQRRFQGAAAPRDPRTEGGEGRSSKKFEKGKMVEFPSTAIIPERDLDKTPVLECRHLGIDFGGLRAVDDFNLTIGRTEIAGLIGPNGAGKTTVFNLLTKVYQPTRGTILLDGMDTSGKTTEQINRMGIARTFQNIRLFSNLTVEDNVKIGLHNQEPYSTFEGIFRLPRYWRQERTAHERALELLSIFDMQDMANVQAGSLPYGAQRRLEIVRALATNP